mgnify:CR=1 FL=1
MNVARGHDVESLAAAIVASRIAPYHERDYWAGRAAALKDLLTDGICADDADAAIGAALQEMPRDVNPWSGFIEVSGSIADNIDTHAEPIALAQGFLRDACREYVRALLVFGYRGIESRTATAEELAARGVPERPPEPFDD